MGTAGFAEEVPYIAPKHGVIGLTRSAALSWGADHIRVTAICPTLFDAPMMAIATDDVWNSLAAMQPLHRLPTAAEVAAMVA